VTLDGEVSNLTQPAGGHYDLGSEWSPNGDAIAFLRYTGNDYELFVADAEGQGLVDFDQTAVGFSWSPDGSQIAYSSFASETDYDILLADRDGRGRRVLVDSPLSDANPAWSPKGDLIAFTSGPVLDRDPGDEDIYVVRPDGTDLTRLTGPGPDGSPVWSPDGARIAFVSQDGGEREVFVMDVDGSGRVAVTDAPTNDVTDPVWSHDGSKIAFGVFSGTDWDVHVVNADGTGQMVLAESPKDEVGAVWAPDGSLIAYSGGESAESCGCDNSGTFDVFVVKPDGTGRTRLTDGAGELGGDLSWRPLP
jgi:Tol biopolymer transport system component